MIQKQATAKNASTKVVMIDRRAAFSP